MMSLPTKILVATLGVVLGAFVVLIMAAGHLAGHALVATAVGVGGIVLMIALGGILGGRRTP